MFQFHERPRPHLFVNLPTTMVARLSERTAIRKAGSSYPQSVSRERFSIQSRCRLGVRWASLRSVFQALRTHFVRGTAKRCLSRAPYVTFLNVFAPLVVMSGSPVVICLRFSDPHFCDFGLHGRSSTGHSLYPISGEVSSVPRETRRLLGD